MKGYRTFNNGGKSEARNAIFFSIQCSLPPVTVYLYDCIYIFLIVSMFVASCYCICAIVYIYDFDFGEKKVCHKLITNKPKTKQTKTIKKTKLQPT